MADRDSKAQPLIKTSHRVALFSGLLALFTLVGGVGGWMAYANIAGAVVASGTVSIKGKPKTIQHLDGGIVSEIKVANGDVVQKDQIVLRLDPTLLLANLKIYRERLGETLARKSRLMAERNMESKITWLDVDIDQDHFEARPDQRQGQQHLFDARKEATAGQIHQLEEKIAQFKNQIDGVKGLKAAKADQLSFIAKELSALNTLMKKGNTTLPRILALKRQKADLDGQNAEHDAELARIENSINETELQILQVRRETRKEILTELRQATQEVNELVQQIYATETQFKRIDIRAPVSGMIHELSVYTVGGVVAPGAPVMQIVPLTEQVEIEAQVEPQFIDELYIGQDATLRFTAFNQQSTPELNGKVRSVSPSSSVDERTGFAFYTVRLAIPKQELRKLSGQKLIPGMQVESFIKTRERTVLNYLVKPLADQIKRAFREE